jgi:multicomponent Na+:H+ antiporter subunit E
VSAAPPLSPTPAGTAALARAALLRLLLLAVLWWVLVEGALGGWALTVLSLAAATAASLVLVPPGSMRLRGGGMARFVPYFVAQSVRGGFDVALRALDPRLPIRPGYHVHTLHLPEGAARTFFIAVVGLLPGTLSVEVLKGRVRVHVLDERMPVAATLRELEERVGAMFGG